MPRPSKLSDDEIRSQLQALEGWSYQDGKLHKTFRFADFIAAWGFMSRIALIAQAMDHHPDWSNVYNTVTVALSTHDAGGVTRLDLELARKTNENA